MLVFYFVLVFISHICSRVFLSLQNRELQIMRKLDHCNIVRLRYFFYSSGEKVQLVICFRLPLVFVFFAFGLAEKSKVVKQTFMSPFSHTLNTIVSLKKGSDPFLGMTNIETFLILSCRSSLLETRF